MPDWLKRLLSPEARTEALPAQSPPQQHGQTPPQQNSQLAGNVITGLVVLGVSWGVSQLNKADDFDQWRAAEYPKLEAKLDSLESKATDTLRWQGSVDARLKVQEVAVPTLASVETQVTLLRGDFDRHVQTAGREELAAARPADARETTTTSDALVATVSLPDPYRLLPRPDTNVIELASVTTPSVVTIPSGTSSDAPSSSSDSYADTTVDTITPFESFVLRLRTVEMDGMGEPQVVRRPLMERPSVVAPRSGQRMRPY